MLQLPENPENIPLLKIPDIGAAVAAIALPETQSSCFDNFAVQFESSQGGAVIISKIKYFAQEVPDGQELFIDCLTYKFSIRANILGPISLRFGLFASDILVDVANYYPRLGANDTTSSAFSKRVKLVIPGGFKIGCYFYQRFYVNDAGNHTFSSLGVNGFFRDAGTFRAKPSAQTIDAAAAGAKTVGALIF